MTLGSYADEDDDVEEEEDNNVKGRTVGRQKEKWKTRMNEWVEWVPW